MADPHQETEKVDTPEVHGISDNIVILNSDQIENGLNNGILHHHLVDGNQDPTSIAYVVPNTEQSESPLVTDTAVSVSGRPTVGAVSGLGLRSVSLVDDFNLTNSDISHGEIHGIQNSGHSVMVQINGSDNILVNSSQQVVSSASDTDTGVDNRDISNVAQEAFDKDEASISNNQITRLPHQVPTESVLMYSSSNSNDRSLQNAQQSITTIATTDHQNQQTTILLNQENNNEASQVIDDKSQLKLHTMQHTPALQVAAPQGISMTPEILQSVIQQVKAQQLSQHSSQVAHSSQELQVTEAESQNNGVSFTLVSPNPQTSAAPLGSSQNPIRIIQQGNRYTPMQQLTTEQLQQIMQVVQQQHNTNATKPQDNSGTVIFNPHTNTKIMYRVIYPSELHKAQAASGQATYQVIKPVTLSQEQQTANAAPNQKRPYRKRKEAVAQLSGVVAAEGDEDKDRGSGEAPELSREEKAERKKHRPRTRSGRVSKPPKHMVQDYKHIHVLDWDEDYDDSDGGYSDLKQSDEESRARQNEEGEQETSPDLFQALGAGKPKNYKCQTCEKSYIGHAGLERHYRLTPDHRITEDGGVGSQVHNGLLLADGEDSSKDTSITQDGNSRNSDPGPEISKSNGLMDNFSEDSNTQDSVNSIGTSSPLIRRGRGRGSYRGRWAHLKHSAHTRRKNKLREFTKMCSDEDLMEVLFPRLVGCISTWEFLLMKAEKGGSRPKVDVIYKEFEDLLRPLKKVCAGYMKPIAETELPNPNTNEKLIKVTDQNLASCLDLDVGTYRVEEMLPDDSNSFSSLHNKLSAASISLSTSTSSEDRSNTSEGTKTFYPERIILGGKRKYEPISHSNANNSPMKKPHFINSVSSNISPEQSSLPMNGIESIKTEPTLLQTASGVQLSSSASHSLQPATSQSHFIKFESTSEASTSHPPISYFISSSNGKDTNMVASSQALKSQLVPVVLNTGAGTNSVAVSSSQILPVVFNPQTSRTTVSTTATGNKTGQISSLPLLLAAPGGQFQGNAIYFAPGNQTASQSVLVKQPSPNTKQAPTLQQQQKSVTSQQNIVSPITKPQISLLGSVNKTNGNATAKVSVASVSSSSIHPYDTNTKPAEVKVSRKLFLEATASSSLSLTTTNSSLSSIPSLTSFVTSGAHSNNTTFVTSPHKLKANTVSMASLLLSSSVISSHADNTGGHLQTASCTSIGNVKRELANEVLNFNNLEFNRGTEGPIIVSAASLSTSEINRVVTSGNDEDLDSSFDISAGVLSSIGFSGDELSSLNTSSENPSSIPVSLPNLGVNQMNSVINEIIATSSNNIPNGVPLIQPPKIVTENGSSLNHVSNTDSPFINGSTTEFPAISPPSLKLKDNNILLQGSQSSSSFISSSSDFIHLLSNKPSSPLMSSPCKDTSLNNSTTSVSFNIASMDNSLPSQILKSEGTPSAMMDLGALTFPDQSVEQQLTGVTSGLHSSDVDSILPEQMTQSDQVVNPLLELPQQLVGDDMTISAPAGEEDGQFLLTEGSNIYQTEDGTWFIQSADGNTYQLQGAQGLPMETVQALLSGNLDLNGDAQADETVQV